MYGEPAVFPTRGALACIGLMRTADPIVEHGSEGGGLVWRWVYDGSNTSAYAEVAPLFAAAFRHLPVTYTVVVPNELGFFGGSVTNQALPSFGGPTAYLSALRHLRDKVSNNHE